MKGPQTKLFQGKNHFGEEVTVEEAITKQVNSMLEAFLREFKRQESYGECRSIRGATIINFQGGKFALDMRLLPDDEVETDELYQIVEQHLLTMKG